MREGAPLGNLDLGGGLAVDYEGSRSSHTHSMNYSMEEYCLDIIEVVMSILDPHDIPHPTIVTESGRALVATVRYCCSTFSMSPASGLTHCPSKCRNPSTRMSTIYGKC